MAEGERKGGALAGWGRCEAFGWGSLCSAALAGSLVLVSFLSPGCIDHVRTNLK